MAPSSPRRGADVLGFPIEVIDGVEEGRYGFLGATSELDESLAPFLVLDIGGGSTELATGTDRVRRGSCRSRLAASA